MQWFGDYWWLVALVLALFALGLSRQVYYWLKCRLRGAPASFQEVLELRLLNCPMRQTIDAYLRMRGRGSSISLSDLKRAFKEDPAGFPRYLERAANSVAQTSETPEG
jgi:hypothetical protein